MRATDTCGLDVRRAFLIALAAILAVALTFVSLWAQGRIFPTWVEWRTPHIALDLDGDGTVDTIDVSMRRAVVAERGVRTYSTPPDWYVFDVLAGDITHDGSPEIALLVWKRGSFGESRPFWIERDTPVFTQHVFLFQYRNRQIVPLWMTSDLGFSVKSGSLDDAGRLHLLSPDETESIWEWQSWGLALVEAPENDDAFEAAAAKPQRITDSPEGTIRLLAVGDNLAHENVYESAWNAERQTFDFSPIYAEVAPKISTYDLAVVNQETPLTRNWELRSSFPVFATPDTMADALVGAGFNVILCANNHANDIGPAGTADTLARFGLFPEVTVLGIHESAEDAETVNYFDTNGVRLALFDYTFGLNGWSLAPDEAYRIDTLDSMPKLLSDLAQAQREADCSIVFLHIGEEYATEPTEEQRVIAAQLIDAGADSVICSHAHVAQEVEWLTTDAGNTGLVCWSLGNFMSGQSEPGTDTGIALELTITREGITSYDLISTTCRFDEHGAHVEMNQRGHTPPIH